MNCVCKDCGRAFEITAGEEQFYKDKGLSLPKRCRECREKRKNGVSGGDNGNVGSDGSAEKSGNERSHGTAGKGGNVRRYSGDADKMARDIRNSAADDGTEDYGRKRKGPDPKKILPTVVFLVIALIVIGVFSLMRGNTSQESASTESSATTAVQTSGEADTETDDGQDSAAAGNEDDTAVTSSPATGTTVEYAPSEDTSAAYTSTTAEQKTSAVTATAEAEKTYRFRNSSLLNQHYEKHGKEMGFASAAEYQAAARAVIENPNALHKTEAEDGDGVYYIKSTGEFVILSTDGYIRTYFIADYDYYLRQ